MINKEKSFWDDHNIEEEIIKNGHKMQELGHRLKYLFLSPCDYLRLTRSLGSKFNGILFIANLKFGISDEVQVMFTHQVQDADPVDECFIWEYEPRNRENNIPEDYNMNDLKKDIRTLNDKIELLSIQLDLIHRSSYKGVKT